MGEDRMLQGRCARVSAIDLGMFLLLRRFLKMRSQCKGLKLCPKPSGLVLNESLCPLFPQGSCLAHTPYCIQSGTDIRKVWRHGCTVERWGTYLQLHLCVFWRARESLCARTATCMHALVLFFVFWTCAGAHLCMCAGMRKRMWAGLRGSMKCVHADFFNDPRVV